MNKIIIVCGPTGSGKSSLSINLAKKLKTEIISADSLAVYKNLDIGTAKPTKEEMKMVKHHLIDVVSPFENFSVGDYKDLASPIIKELLENGKIPIICGGTGFYINSLIYDMGYGNAQKNLEVREKFLKLAEEKGVDYVFSELEKVDKESSLKIHKNDVKRVVRALEIFYSTGQKKSEQKDSLNPIYNYVAVMINHDRDVLYDRINRRVDEMFDSGLVDEVKSLMDMGITIDNQCMQGIGYKEVYDAIISNNFENLKDIIKLNSRHYAKRQITFFKKLPNLHYLDSSINLEEFVLNELEK